MAGGDEVDPGLARVRHHVLARLAGQERVEPQGDRLGQASAAEPETMPIRRTRSGPPSNTSGVAGRHLAHALEELGGRDAVAGERAGAADLRP